MINTSKTPRNNREWIALHKRQRFYTNATVVLMVTVPGMLMLIAIISR